MKWVTKHKGQIFLALIALLALRVFVPQLSDLKQSLQSLKDADLTWVFAAIVVYFSGIPVMTMQYMALAMKKLYFALTFQVEMATLFVNKLLPSGVGTISLNFYYLLKKKHTPTEATAVMTVNSITSFVAYCMLILAALVTSKPNFKEIDFKGTLPVNLIIFIFILFLGAGVTIYRSGNIKAKIKNIWTKLKHDIASFKRRPKSVIVGIVCNGVGSLTSIFALYASAVALGFSISFGEALLAYTFGNIAAALIPTPGGIGSAEAGIYSGLVLCGINGPDALIITLLYRLITYWLPIAPGYYYFWKLRKTLMADYSVNRKVNEPLKV